MTIVYLSPFFIFNLFATSQNEEMVQIRGKYEWLIDLCTVFISPTQKKKKKKILENLRYTRHVKYLQNVYTG